MVMVLELSEGRKVTVSGSSELILQLRTFLPQERSAGVILCAGEEHYVQAMPSGDGYCVEKHDGQDRHYQAQRRRPAAEWEPQQPGTFPLDGVVLIFEDYLAGRDSSAFVHWQPLPLSRPLPGAGRRVVLGLLILLAAVVLGMVGIFVIGGFSVG